MARPTYTYKGFKLYIACPAVYNIDRLDDTYAYLERPPRGKNSTVTVYNTGDWDTYAKLSARGEGESYGKMSAREAFYRWVDENYGDAYARKH